MGVSGCVASTSGAFSLATEVGISISCSAGVAMGHSRTRQQPHYALSALYGGVWKWVSAIAIW